MDAFDRFLAWFAELACSYFLLIAVIFAIGGGVTFLVDKAFDAESNEWWNEDANGMRVSAEVAGWMPTGGALFSKSIARPKAGAVATRGLRNEVGPPSVGSESAQIAREVDSHDGIGTEIAGHAIDAVIDASFEGGRADGLGSLEGAPEEDTAVLSSDRIDIGPVPLQGANGRFAVEERGDIAALRFPETKVFPGEIRGVEGARMSQIDASGDEAFDGRSAYRQAMSPYCLTRSGVSSPGKMRPVGATCGVDKGTHVEYGRITFYARNELGDICVTRSGRSSPGGELLPVGTPCLMDFGTHVEQGEIFR